MELGQNLGAGISIIEICSVLPIVTNSKQKMRITYMAMAIAYHLGNFSVDTIDVTITTDDHKVRNV